MLNNTSAYVEAINLSEILLSISHTRSLKLSQSLFHLLFLPAKTHHKVLKTYTKPSVDKFTLAVPFLVDVPAWTHFLINLINFLLST